MNETMTRQLTTPPLGLVEPHGPLLKLPPAGQSLYKIMKVENLLRSVTGSYLHFNRVDSYKDFPDADPHDGRQLPKDQPINERIKIGKGADFSAKDYYDRSRARTYACCLSLENLDFIWNNYANGSEKDKVCVVFDFEKLRSTLNQTLQPGNTALEYKGIRCHQIFSVNYGIIEYVEWDNYQTNAEYPSNPIIYTYLKSKKYSEEKEFRISLSAIGIGRFILNDGSAMDFPPSLQMDFDFRAAIVNGTISEILCAPDCDKDYLFVEMEKLGILPG